MTFIQAVTPNPNIPCKPGWCLEYVRSTYGLPAAYPTATAAWEASASKHQDQDFPEGCWVPVWFSLANEPAGHVALRAPDGSVYSTSDLTNVPHQHPNLADLIGYYAYYGMPLTYLGWTEDVAGYPVIADGGIAAMGSTTIQEDDMPLTPEDRKAIALEVWAFKNEQIDARDMRQIVADGPKDTWTVRIDHRNPATGELEVDATTPETVLSYIDANTQRIVDAKTIVASIPDSIAQEVIDALAARLGK